MPPKRPRKSRRRAAAPKTAAATRRVPTQERSQKRYEAILDAAALLFAEQGVAMVTMEAIAAKSNTSIGSLYQFWPNKLAVFEAMVKRCLARSEAMFEQTHSPQMLALPWTDLLDAAIDGFTFLERSDPSFRAVWRNLPFSLDYEEADEALRKQYIARSQAVFAALMPDAPPERHHLIATIVVQTIAAMLFSSFREDKTTAAAMIEETRLMLRSYVASQLR